MTGPVMVYDEALFKFSKSAEVEYLPWRVWISFWCLIIAATVACFQGSFVVKYFTKFTKDIFASFIATVFIIEALLKTAGVSFSGSTNMQWNPPELSSNYIFLLSKWQLEGAGGCRV